MRTYIDIVRLLETDLPEQPHLTRQFDMMQIDNRRFMFNPRSQRFLLGHALGAGTGKKSIRASHAEEYYEVHQSNAGFDQEVRGWVGTGKNYPHGVIHFAPPIISNFDAGYTCLEAFAKRCGATDQTLVRGFPGAWEQPLGAILRARSP